MNDRVEKIIPHAKDKKTCKLHGYADKCKSRDL